MENLLSEIEQKELNKFGLLELTASQNYLHLSNRMKTLGYFGAEKFFLSESNSERKHYGKIKKFANDLGGEVSVESLEKVTSTVANIKEALEHAYQMEKDLMMEYEKAAIRTDLTLKVVLLLQDFTTHQVGAVGEYGDLLARLALTDNMLLFDQELGN